MQKKIRIGYARTNMLNSLRFVKICPLRRIDFCDSFRYVFKNFINILDHLRVQKAYSETRFGISTWEDPSYYSFIC